MISVFFYYKSKVNVFLLNRTISLYMGSIRHLFNEAKKKYNDYDKNIILIPNSPFEHVDVPKQEATRKRALSAELVKRYGSYLIF